MTDTKQDAAGVLVSHRNGIVKHETATRAEVDPSGNLTVYREGAVVGIYAPGDWLHALSLRSDS